jgi:MYXO-CTERM domain-containing protein
VQGTLPLGITLSSTGVLAGNPRSTQMDGAVPLTFEVQDAWGSRARRAFTLRVVSPGALLISSATLPDGLVGSPYDRDIAVVNADATPLATPLAFTVSRGSLPDGVRLQQAAQVALLTGSPRVAGLFAFSLTVVDARGRTDTADYVVRVGSAGLKLTVAGKDSARPGETVELTLTASSGAGTQFAFEGGRLPGGVSMAPSGVVSGTVAADVLPGTYDFVVSARDGTGSQGLGAFSLRVDAPVVVAKGCSATDGAAVGWLLLAALPLLRRRPRVG